LDIRTPCHTPDGRGGVERNRGGEADDTVTIENYCVMMHHKAAHESGNFNYFFLNYHEEGTDLILFVTGEARYPLSFMS
jgi:hypothetical protein